MTIEDRPTFEQATSHAQAGIDLADAMHHASYRSCSAMASFDDREFGRPAKKVGLVPRIAFPA